MFCDSYILTLNELELSLEIDDIPLETELDSLDEDSADDDELSSEFASELSLETELSELASLDEPASPAGRLLELADSELEEDEAVSELDEDEDDDSAVDEKDDSEDELLKLA